MESFWYMTLLIDSHFKACVSGYNKLISKLFCLIKRYANENVDKLIVANKSDQN